MIKIRLILSLLLLLTLSVISSNHSISAASPKAVVGGTALEEWSHPSGFKFWLPDNWKTKEEGETLVAEGPGVAVIFIVPKNARSLDRALDEVEEELSGWLKNIKYDEPTASNEGGIAEVFITGTGKDRESGEDMEFDLGIYEKKGKTLMVFGCTTAENFDKYDKTFIKILDSIR